MGYVWSFGDGIISTFKNPVHVYDGYGQKTVKLKVISEFGCSDSIQSIINLLESPKAAFSNTEVCSIDPTRFTNNTVEPSTGNTSYKWYFGTGDSSLLVSPSYKYNSRGSYTVTLIAHNDNGCENMITKQVSVKVQPVADFVVSDVCAGETVKFFNRSEVELGNTMTYSWKFGDASASIDMSPDHIYNATATTTYNATLYTKAVGGCTDSVTKPVIIYGKPTCDFTVSNKANRRFEFASDNASGVTYQWVFGDGGSSTAPVENYQYQIDGNYTVTLVATTTDGNCVCSKQRVLSVSQFNSTGASVDQGQIQVYPNPSTGKFTVNVAEAGQVNSIAVYNAVGMLVNTVDVHSASGNAYEVNLSDMANGIYVVKVIAGDHTFTQKVTINR